MSRKWSDLGPRTRKLIIAGAVVEAALKVAVLVDLKRRPPEQVRGSRRAWAAAMALNSFGALPAAYFLIGRHPRRPA